MKKWSFYLLGALGLAMTSRDLWNREWSGAFIHLTLAAFFFLLPRAKKVSLLVRLMLLIAIITSAVMAV